MADKTINSFIELHDFVESFGKRVVVYRGQKSVEWELKPNIGRLPLKSDENAKEEQTMIRLFQERAIQNLDYTPDTLWDWLAIEHHHGLPTRLLDWTRNPLVAAFFAVTEAFDGDSVVYAYHNNKYINLEKNPDPFLVNEIKRVIPRHVTNRITSQAGLFTIHPGPKEDCRNVEGITRMIIRNDFRKKLKSILYKYGVHRANLFPDIDGLANHIRWLRTKEY